MNDDKPIYLQIIDIIEDKILDETYKTDDIIISTNQIAKIYSVNPTTAVKAVSLLANKGILYKKRGIGMAVTKEARAIILKEKKYIFMHQQLQEIISSANKLGIDKQELIQLILDINDKGEIKND